MVTGVSDTSTLVLVGAGSGQRAPVEMDGHVPNFEQFLTIAKILW